MRERRTDTQWYGMDIFTTAYPRSGSTWLGRILSDLLGARQQAIPDDIIVDEFAREINPEYVIRKTHWYNWQYPGVGYDKKPCKIIWITRDPRDMCVSIMYYRGLTPDKLQSTIVSLDNPKQPDNIGIHAFVRGWTETPPDFHVTYEELHNDPYPAIAGMFQTITGKVPNSPEIKKLVKRQQFHVIAPEYPHSMRKGIIGDWKNHFKYDDAVLFEKLYGDLLRELGYETDPNWVNKVSD